jgi:hypothetical protein
MKITVFAFLALLCGCVHLSHVQPQAGHSAEQQRLDADSCKEEARLAASTPGRVVGSALLGLTLVGLPIALGLDASKQQEVFADCMHAKGYALSPPGS